MSDRRHTVLVAEDEPHLLRLVQFRLEREGYDVVTAVDGQSALDAVFDRASRPVPARRRHAAPQRLGRPDASCAATTAAAISRSSC